VLALEVLLLIALAVSLGGLLRLWLSRWGLALLGVVILGMLLPLALRRRAAAPRGRGAPVVAVLVLVAGFLLRIVIVFSSERL
jgi:formate-dependent nitrite reductase membrane component NrfD